MNSAASPPGGQQSTAGKPPTCYNCGDSDHYFDACPEPARKIPVGLAAAQAAKVNSGPQSQNGGYYAQDNRAKRQKTGSGPVVTRYPIPGPVVTKYGTPGVQHQPYGGPQGFNVPPQPFHQNQYSQQPQQQFAPHMPQVQNNAYPYGYQQPHIPQSATYNQYGQHPPAPQAQAYGSMPPQGQGYGYAPSVAGSYYDQYGQQMPYGQPHPQYPQQMPAQYPAQAPMPYQQQGMQQYGPSQQPAPYPPGPYQAGLHAHPYGYDMSQYPQGQPPGQQPPTFQSFQGAQSFNGPNGHYPNQQPQQWAQPQGPAQSSPAAYGPSNYGGSNNATTRRASREHLHNQPFQSHGGLPSNDSSQPASNDAVSGQENENGSTITPAQTDEFDLVWEELVFNDLANSSAIAILTPLSTIYDDTPVVSTFGADPLKSKYVRPSNLEVFMLPIQKSLHWATLQKDPALARIDEAYPVVPFDAWDDYREERRKRNLMEAGVYDIPQREGQWYETVQEDVDDQVIRDSVDHVKIEVRGPQESAEAAVRQGSNAFLKGSRSRSHTPNVGSKGTPVLAPEDDAWAPQLGEGQTERPASVDPAEALLASLGVTGTPKPVSGNSPVQMFPGPTGSHFLAQMESVQQVNAPPPTTRQDSGYASARPSFSNGHQVELNKINGGRQNSWSNQTPAPPPPPPAHLRSGYDGYIDSPVSEGSLQSHRSGRNNGKPNSKSASPEESPLSPTSAALLGQVPTTYSDDRYAQKKEPLRQDDDYFVKKRPQPKVDDAYSRRW